MNIGYHVWYADNPEKMEKLGFVKRDGYWDKFIESQMTKDYVKIFPSYL